jgi:hypothetical protein
VAIAAVVFARAIGVVMIFAAREGVVPPDAARIVLGVATTGLWVGAILVWVWLYRVVSNILAFGRHDFPFTPGWAIGWWFIPIASLWKIPQIMSAAWRGSDPADLQDSWRSWHINPSTPLIAVWWATYLFNSFAGLAAKASPLFASGMSAILWTVSGVALVMIIGGIDTKQEALAARVQEMV